MVNENEEKKTTDVAPEGTDNSGQVAQANADKENKDDQQPSEKTPREALHERIRAARPDGKYDEDEDEIYRQAGSWLDELEAGSKSYKDLADKLAARFNEDPEEANAFLDYLEGMHLVAAIRKNMGDEALTMQEGDEGWDEYQKAGETRKADSERLMGYAKEINENSAASDALFEEWAGELELDDEQKKAVLDLIQGDLEALMKGKLSKDVLNRYSKAINHDSDVEAAHKQGKVEGRGEAIDAQRKRMKGSGLPGGEAGGDINGKTNDNPRAELARKIQSIRMG